MSRKMKSVLLATKSKLRGVQENPSTILRYVFKHNEPPSQANDLTTIPFSLMSILKEFQDVFPNEVPLGFPPLRDLEHRIDIITDTHQSQLHDLLEKGHDKKLTMLVTHHFWTKMKGHIERLCKRRNKCFQAKSTTDPSMIQFLLW
jgi:hypothetical protein